jgi:hypothetical protein
MCSAQSPRRVYGWAMDDLTSGQLDVLRDLARKKAGEAVRFVNIADARALTDLGLAQRSREGWDITPEGSAWLADRPETPANTDPA